MSQANYNTCQEVGTCGVSVEGSGVDCAASFDGSETSCEDQTGCTYTIGTIADTAGVFADKEACEAFGGICQRCSNDDGNMLNLSDCLRNGVCSDDTISEHGQTLCEDNGKTWTAFTIIDLPDMSKNDCEDVDENWFKKVNFAIETNTWYVGELKGGRGMAGYDEDGTCTDEDVCKECDSNFPTGDFILSGDPNSLLAQHVIKNFVNDTVFLKDARAGKSFAASKTGTPLYYNSLQNWIVYLSHVAVSASSIDGATTQNLIMAQSGLSLLFKPTNAGSITTQACGDGADQTMCPPGTDLTAADLHLVVIEPTNLDTGDNKIAFSNGKVTVAGGTNDGMIEFTTTGAVKVEGIVNSGTVSFENSQDIFIAGLPNSGNITFKNTKTTFVDVVNEENGMVEIDGGDYAVYGLVNHGNVHIKSGSVHGEVKCNYGTITVDAGVTGSVTVTDDSDCAGTIIGDGAADVASIDTIPEFKVQQGLSFTGVNMTAATLDTPASRAAVKGKIADGLGVTAASVEILSIEDVAVRRMALSRRKLERAATRVDIKYEVTVSDAATEERMKEKMEELKTDDTKLQLIADIVVVEMKANGAVIAFDAEIVAVANDLLEITTAPTTAPSAAPATTAPSAAKADGGDGDGDGDDDEITIDAAANVVRMSGAVVAMMIATLLVGC